MRFQRFVYVYRTAMFTHITFRLRLIGFAVPEMLRHQPAREIRKRRSPKRRNLLSRNDKKRSGASMSGKKVAQILSKQNILITCYCSRSKLQQLYILLSASFSQGLLYLIYFITNYILSRVENYILLYIITC